MLFIVRSEDGKQNDGDSIDPQGTELSNKCSIGDNDLQQSDLCRFIDVGKENSRGDKTQQHTQIDVTSAVAFMADKSKGAAPKTFTCLFFRAYKLFFLPFFSGFP